MVEHELSETEVALLYPTSAVTSVFMRLSSGYVLKFMCALMHVCVCAVYARVCAYACASVVCVWLPYSIPPVRSRQASCAFSQVGMYYSCKHIPTETYTRHARTRTPYMHTHTHAHTQTLGGYWTCIRLLSSPVLPWAYKLVCTCVCSYVRMCGGVRACACREKGCEQQVF